MMPTYATGVAIALGDWVRVFLPRKGVWHHGIVRQIYWAGTGFAVEIANNAKGFGIIASDCYQFSDGQNVQLHRRASTATQIAEILARVENSLGKPYRLFAHNCEHFASFAFSGKAESDTVKAVGLFAALAVVVIGLLASE